MIYFNFNEQSLRNLRNFARSQKHLTEELEFLRTSDFFFLQWHHSYVEVVVHIQNLVKVLLLHFGTSFAHPAGVLWEKYLIDHNIANVDLKGC